MCCVCAIACGVGDLVSPKYVAGYTLYLSCGTRVYQNCAQFNADYALLVVCYLRYISESVK